MRIVRHLQHFWPSTKVRLIGQCWYFKPQWTPEQPINLYRYERLPQWEQNRSKAMM